MSSTEPGAADPAPPMLPSLAVATTFPTAGLCESSMGFPTPFADLGGEDDATAACISGVPSSTMATSVALTPPPHHKLVVAARAAVDKDKSPRSTLDPADGFPFSGSEMSEDNDDDDNKAAVGEGEVGITTTTKAGDSSSAMPSDTAMPLTSLEKQVSLPEQQLKGAGQHLPTVPPGGLVQRSHSVVSPESVGVVGPEVLGGPPSMPLAAQPPPPPVDPLHPLAQPPPALPQQPLTLAGKPFVTAQDQEQLGQEQEKVRGIRGVHQVSKHAKERRESLPLPFLCNPHNTPRCGAGRTPEAKECSFPPSFLPSFLTQKERNPFTDSLISLSTPLSSLSSSLPSPPLPSHTSHSPLFLSSRKRHTNHAMIR